MTGKWHQRVITGKNCPGCNSNNIQLDKKHRDVLKCRTCGFTYEEIKCSVCGSSAVMNFHTGKEVCKHCGSESE